jgi:hypothetical protein
MPPDVQVWGVQNKGETSKRIVILTYFPFGSVSFSNPGVRRTVQPNRFRVHRGYWSSFAADAVERAGKMDS